jgi:nicotinamide riboside transporter PnuC
MLDFVSQALIFTLGITSIILVARKNKWGFIAAIVVQPFWIFSSYRSGQWGIFLVSFVYTGSWIYGAYRWFAEDRRAKEKKGKQTTGPSANG